MLCGRDGVEVVVADVSFPMSEEASHHIIVFIEQSSSQSIYC